MFSNPVQATEAEEAKTCVACGDVGCGLCGKAGSLKSPAWEQLVALSWEVLANIPPPLPMEKGDVEEAHMWKPQELRDQRTCS